MFRVFVVHDQKRARLVTWAARVDGLDDAPRTGRGCQRRIGEVRLDELGDQFGRAVVQSVRPRHDDDVEVREHRQHVSAVDSYERIALTDDDQRGHDEVRQPLQGRVAGHRLEQRQALEHSEPEVVADCDRDHRQRLSRSVHRHLAERSAEWSVVRAAGRRDQHRPLDAVGERRRELDDDRATERVADERRLLDADGVAVGHQGPRQPRQVERSVRVACSVPSRAGRARTCCGAERGGRRWARGTYPRSRTRGRARSSRPPDRRRGRHGETSASRRRSPNRAPTVGPVVGARLHHKAPARSAADPWQHAPSDDDACEDHPVQGDSPLTRSPSTVQAVIDRVRIGHFNRAATTLIAGGPRRCPRTRPQQETNEP